MHYPFIYWQRNIRLLLWMLICTTATQAQTLRSSEPLLQDTVSINRLLDHGYALRENFIDSSAQLYKQAYQASVAINYRNGMADALSGMGRYFNITNQQRKAVAYLKQALQFCENDRRGKELNLSIHLLLSESYYYLGKYDSCALYRYEALNFIEHNKVDNPALRLRVYSKILQFWLNAHEDIRHDKYIRYIMQNIDEIERQALASKDSNLLVNIYFQKEGYHHNISQNDSARYYGLLNIKVGRRHNVLPSMIMAAYLNIALTYLDDKMPDSAIANVYRAIQEAPEQGRASNRYLWYADVFLGQAYAMKHQYEKAISLTLPALQKADAQSIMSIAEQAHQTLADAYEGIGNYQQSALHRKLYSEVKDSMMKTEKMELGYNLDMKYRIAEKNKELAQKELAIIRNENRIRSKNIWIGCITAGLLLISAISMLIYRNNRHKQRLQAQQINSLQQEMEIKLLKAKIESTEEERSRIARDLHDGVSGTLGSIRTQLGMIYRKHNPASETHTDFENIIQMLEEASSDLRKTAHNLMPEILLQEGLVSATALFCERTARGHAINLTFHSIGESTPLPAELELTIYRTIQELVQNILKHAEAKNALVQLVFNGSSIALTVEDDGKGMNAEKGPHAFGAGLKTITERIHSLHGSIDMDSISGEGTSIYIELDTDKSKV